MVAETLLEDFSHLSDKQLRAEINSYKTRTSLTLSDRFRFFMLLNEVGTREKPHTAKKGYVYLMRDEQGVYKIGQSIAPSLRAKQLLEAVEVICEIPTDNMKALESSLQSVFIGKRVKRGSQWEWFALEPDDVEYIKSLAGGA